MPLPDHNGYFGQFGGRFVPDTLVPAIEELQLEYKLAKKDPHFSTQLKQLLKDYVGRPSPLYFARRLSESCGRRVYLKREDLNHTGSHKVNNTLGQIL